MRKSPCLVRSLVFLFVLLPLAFQGVLLGVGALATIVGQAGGPDRGGGAILGGIVGAAGVVFFLYVCLRTGRSLARRSYPKRNDNVCAAASHEAKPAEPSGYFHLRYLGVIVACGYTLSIALIAISLPAGRFGVFENFGQMFVRAHGTSMLLAGAFLSFLSASPWVYFIPPLTIYAACAAGMFWEFRVMRAPGTRWLGRVIFALVLAVWAGVFAWRVDVLESRVLRGFNGETRMDDMVYTEPYVPFGGANKLAKVNAPTLTIADEHPKLDGATALYPVYAAAAQALYKNIDAAEARKKVRVSTTPRAYERLVRGEADVIFCARPSASQTAAAKKEGIEFHLTPLGREAFVFFVNQSNPVDGLASEQLRAIYTRKITNWSDVGGPSDKILPFQRPKDSGSQTAMEQQVMRSEPMAAPLLEERMRGMGGIVLETAAYRNSANAIGYSFRFFVTTMTGTHGVKLLRIDGVAPGVETIRNGTYPYTGNLYAVTTNKTADKPHVQELIAWFLSEQGQKLIEDAGYVSLGAK